ncbi:MAG: response regulator [Chitinivibrionales bacterium]|nr:response regulator [Chitinivibrionales bacterium]
MSDQLIGRPIEILLIEDNPGDARLTREAFKHGTVSSRLHSVGDGEEAIKLLRKEPPFDQVPRPDIIILDLNLPGRDGREVLAEIKNDPALKRIPVIVLTGSTADKDIADTYDNHANCFVAKPIELADYMSMLEAIESFWLATVILPPE